MQNGNSKTIGFFKRIQACIWLPGSIIRQTFAKKHDTMAGGRNNRTVAPECRRGRFLLISEGIVIHLNPAESTLFRLFLSHPEGIAADDLLIHWQELCSIYEFESRYDSPDLREDVLESLCAESKIVFYSNVSRIKKKIVEAVGARKAAGYYIKRGPDGIYRTKAVLMTSDNTR